MTGGLDTMKTIFLTICCALLLIPLVCQAAQPTATRAARDQEIQAAVDSYVRSKIAGLGWEARVKRLTINGKLSLPEGKLDYEVVAPQQWEGWGSINLTLYARLDGRVVGNISLRVDVEALTDMVVPLRQIERDEIITAGDVVFQKREISNASLKAVRSFDDIVGKRARLTLRSNQPVLANQIEKVPLVKSGQMVTIVAENDIIKVSVAGKARNSGAEGDMISVQNLNSLKEIPARVISGTTVRVAF